jgi:hypothetical protein
MYKQVDPLLLCQPHTCTMLLLEMCNHLLGPCDRHAMIPWHCKVSWWEKSLVHHCKSLVHLVGRWTLEMQRL